MTTSYTLGEDFENIIRRFYQLEGYEFIQANPQMRGYDFMVQSPEGERIVVEVKVYRTRVIQRADIIRAVGGLEAARQQAEAHRAILYISSAIAIPVRDTEATRLIDINELAALLRKYPRLLTSLQLLAQQLAPMPITLEEKLSYPIFGDAYLPMSEPLEAEEVVLRGTELCSAIRAVPAGKRGARAFEQRCQDALKYIFETHFSNWQEQKITDGGISRFDLVARISSKHDLWQSIVGYFRSWYVVFEFKNYSSKISQGQIYTTEKYLFAGRSEPLR